MHGRILQRRLSFALVASLALSVSAITVEQASAGPKAAAAGYSSGQVLRAFKSEGLNLVDAAYGTQQPVTTLAEANPPARRGWVVAVYIYKTQIFATQSFQANVRAWRKSGFAVAQAKNVVVAAVPKGHVLGTKAASWPMPGPVAKALAILSRR